MILFALWLPILLCTVALKGAAKLQVPASRAAPKYQNDANLAPDSVTLHPGYKPRQAQAAERAGHTPRSLDASWQRMKPFQASAIANRTEASANLRPAGIREIR